MVGPVARREAVGWLQTRGTSLRRACRVIGLSTATWRYQRRTNAMNVAVLARLQAHAAERARFGYRRLHLSTSARVEDVTIPFWVLGIVEVTCPQSFATP